MSAKTPLSEVMVTELITLDREDTVDKVSDIFKKHTIHHIPIINSSGVLEGIISKSDFLRISYGQSLFRKHNPAEYNQALYRSIIVKDVMTKDVVSLFPYDTIEKAIEIFRKNQFRAVPILDKGKLIGIVSLLDLVLHAYSTSAPTT